MARCSYPWLNWTVKCKSRKSIVSDLNWIRDAELWNKQNEHVYYLFLQKLLGFFLSLVNYLELFVHQFPRHFDAFLDNSFLYFWIFQKRQSRCW